MHEDVAKLLRRYAFAREPAIRDALVERFMPLAHRLARRYRHTGELDDLVQVASMGLVKAIDRFDPSRGVVFSSFAVPTITGELKRYLRDSGWAVRVPRSLQERALRVDKMVEQLAGRLGRSPTVAEVAERLDASLEDVLEAMGARRAYEALSLEAERSARDDDGESYADRLGGEEQAYAVVEYGAAIAPVLKTLPARERRILHLRFVEDLTQSQIAERVGVSQMQISRLLRSSLSRLRAAARA